MIRLLSNRFILLCTLILYTLVLTTTLLYFRFPAEKLKLFCQSTMEQLLPGTHCAIERLSYDFPFNLKARQIRCSSREEQGKEFFSIDQATLTPLVTTPGSHFKVALNSWEGDHTCTLLLDRAGGKFSLTDINVSELNLARIPFLRHAFQREITGHLTGSGTYHVLWKNGKYEANGQGRLTVKKGSFGLLSPILSLQKIDLQNLETDIILQQGRLSLQGGTFSGQELKGNFSGTLGLQAGLRSSTLSFQGELSPLPPLLKNSKHAQSMLILLQKKYHRSSLAFRLDGMVQQPQFRFDS